MKFALFDGGLQTRLAPHLIQPNEGVIYDNLDNSVGHFKPIKDKIDVTTELEAEGIKDFGFFFTVEDEIWYSDSPYDWVVFQNDLYYSDRIGIPQKRVSDGVTANLGIAPSILTPVLTPQGTADPDGDTVQYAITFYNSNDGSESRPTLSDEVVWHSDGIEISNIEVSTDPQVTNVRIYRVGRDLTVFTLIATIANGTTTYIDNVSDINAEGSLLQSADWGQAPEGLKYLTESNAMFFGALGSRLYFTPIGLPNSWPATYFLQMPNEITGIAVTPTGLLVFTEHSTILITGTGPTSLTQQILTTDQGCRTHDSVVNVQGAAMWVSNDGICVSNGGQVRVISKEKLGKLNLTIVSSIVYDESYVAQLDDKTTLVWDFAYGSIPKKWDYQVTSLAIGYDEIYGFEDGKIYQLTHGVNPKIGHFKSGWFTSNDIIHPKVHDRFDMAYKGELIVRFYVDGELAIDREFSSLELDVVQSKFPKIFTRNHYVELEIIGTGEMYELDLLESSANE